MQIDRTMIEVATENGMEMRPVDHVDMSENWLCGRMHRQIEAIQPVLYPGERAFHCLDGTIHVVSGIPD